MKNLQELIRPVCMGQEDLCESDDLFKQAMDNMTSTVSFHMDMSTMASWIDQYPSESFLSLNVLAADRTIIPYAIPLDAGSSITPTR